MNFSTHSFHWPNKQTGGLQPCKTDLLAWNDFSKVELIDEVYSIPNKVDIPANHVEIIGAGVGQFDGVAYGSFPTINLGTVHTIIMSLSDVSQVSAGTYILGNTASFSNQIRIIGTGMTVIYNAGGVSTTLICDIDNGGHEVIIDRVDMELKIYLDGVLTDTKILGSNPNLVVNELARTQTTISVPFSISNISFLENNIAKNIFTFSATKGDTAFDSSGNGNNLTLVNADLTTPGSATYFWQKDDTGTIPPTLAIEGCWLRDDGVYLEKGVDVTGMTVTEIKPFEWEKLPYEFRYPDIPAFQPWNKLDTAVWGDNFTGTLDVNKFTWTYQELQTIEQYKQAAYVTTLYASKKALLTYSENIAGDCKDKTDKYLKDNILRDENRIPLLDENGKMITT